MRKIIDIHTHAFPDAIAERAMSQMEAEIDFKAPLDGKLSTLLASMDRTGIETSVLCHIATKPSQFEPILQWSQQIRSDRIIPFPSIHPADPQAVEHIRQIAEAGFLGMKFHPYYQDFDLDSPRMDPIYLALCDCDLIGLFHTGFDIAFEHIDRAGPKRILNVTQKFPKLKFIATHLGSWKQWDDVEQYLLGKPVFFDMATCREFMTEQRFRHFLTTHPADYLLFGTDSPWIEPSRAIEEILTLNIPEDRLEKLFYSNACRLLTKDH
jgi:predicted TIM-barrel fold metal-dependent hydrolase